MRVIKKTILIGLLLTAGCEPKFHGRQLSEIECQQMTCREIDIEIAKNLSEIENYNKNFDELWFPNLLEYKDKDFYLKSRNEVIKQLQDLKAKKGCSFQESEPLNKKVYKVEEYIKKSSIEHKNF